MIERDRENEIKKITIVKDQIDLALRIYVFHTKNGLLFAKKYTTRQFRTTLAVGDNNDNINVGTKKKKNNSAPRHCLVGANINNGSCVVLRDDNSSAVWRTSLLYGFAESCPYIVGHK